ncbi:MAG TPA: hypothetical protein VK017_01815 [Sphingobacterium sp.]|nr:hypothetical protein [Sphingobacterium sp.]
MEPSTLLILHSYYRWIVLAVMLFQFSWLLYHRYMGSVFQKKHFNILFSCAIVYNIQLLIGVLLYMHSPLVKAFLNDWTAGLKNRQLRFFGLEHITMMTLALFFSNIITIQSRRRIGTAEGFPFLWRRYIWIFLMILSSIPWSFSPLTSRPNLR